MPLDDHTIFMATLIVTVPSALIAVGQFSFRACKIAKRFAEKLIELEKESERIQHYRYLHPEPSRPLQQVIISSAIAIFLLVEHETLPHLHKDVKKTIVEERVIDRVYHRREHVS